MRGAGSRGPGESMRGTGGNRDDLPTLRVTNISEDTQENDLRELFGVFGRVARVYVGRDRETGAGKGFAFVSFEDKANAQKAIDKVHGRGYDNLILSVQWSRKLSSCTEACSDLLSRRAQARWKMSALCITQLVFQPIYHIYPDLNLFERLQKEGMRRFMSAAFPWQDRPPSIREGMISELYSSEWVLIGHSHCQYSNEPRSLSNHHCNVPPRNSFRYFGYMRPRRGGTRNGCLPPCI